MILFQKKENGKVLIYTLDNIRIIFVILWLLVSGVLSAKLVLRYQQFEAIL